MDVDLFYTCPKELFLTKFFRNQEQKGSYHSPLPNCECNPCFHLVLIIFIRIQFHQQGDTWGSATVPEPNFPNVGLCQWLLSPTVSQQCIISPILCLLSSLGGPLIATILSLAYFGLWINTHTWSTTFTHVLI